MVMSEVGHQGCQASDEIHRIERHLGRPIPVRGRQGIDNLLCAEAQLEHHVQHPIPYLAALRPLGAMTNGAKADFSLSLCCWCNSCAISGKVLMNHTLTGGVMAQQKDSIALPEVAVTGEQTLQQLLRLRRSNRKFEDAPLSLSEIGQLLWAAQGITHQGHRTTPSAGALYPLELYLVAGQVEGIEAGIYRYSPKSHRLNQTADGDRRKRLTRAAMWQSWIKDAAAVVVFAAVYERTTWKYGKRGVRYVHIEVGHAAQNLHLQVEALGLGTTAVGAFDDKKLANLLQLPADTEPLLLMPVGRQ